MQLKSWNDRKVDADQYSLSGRDIATSSDEMEKGSHRIFIVGLMFALYVPGCHGRTEMRQDMVFAYEEQITNERITALPLLCISCTPHASNRALGEASGAQSSQNPISLRAAGSRFHSGFLPCPRRQWLALRRASVSLTPLSPPRSRGFLVGSPSGGLWKVVSPSVCPWPFLIATPHPLPGTFHLFFWACLSSTLVILNANFTVNHLENFIQFLFLKKWNRELPYHSAIPLLGIHPKELKTGDKTSTRM